MTVRLPLPAEILLARAAARLSRLAGAGGGTTVPGKLLWRLDPGAVDRLAARLPRGAALVSATNGKTTTSAMAARILEPSTRLAHNRSGANLVSGVASALLAARDAELGLFEVDEAALPEIARRVRPRAGAPARHGEGRPAQTPSVLEDPAPRRGRRPADRRR